MRDERGSDGAMRDKRRVVSPLSSLYRSLSLLSSQ